MTRRTAAITLLIVTTLCMLLAALMPDEDWPLPALVSLGVVLTLTASIGTLIAIRADGNRVGWVMIAIGLSVAAGMLATQYTNRALVDRPGSLPFGYVAAWMQSWLWTPLVALFPWLVLYFPTGEPPSPRWRIVGRGALVVMIGATLSVAFRPGPFDTFPAVINPFGVDALARIQRVYDAAWAPITFAVFGGAAASVVFRFRRSRGVERQQLKWFAYAVASAVVLVSLNPLTWASGLHRLGEWTTLVFGAIGPLLAFLALPLGIGTAILRHRLYDIDRIISRTLSYGGVTALLGGAFALVALGPALVVGTGESPDYVIAAATLVVAALFRPVRRRVQDAVDHRFNRRRYDAERTIEAFSSRLRQQVDIDALGAELRALVATTMHPSHVSLWVRPPSRPS